MSQCYNVTKCHNVTISQCLNVTMSQCHNVTMLQRYNVTMLQTSLIFLCQKGVNYTCTAVVLKETWKCHVKTNVTVFHEQKLRAASATNSRTLAKIDTWCSLVTVIYNIVWVNIYNLFQCFSSTIVREVWYPTAEIEETTFFHILHPYSFMTKMIV